jgi:predicted DNA-binding ribbon-helix-helix protein
VISIFLFSVHLIGVKWCMADKGNATVRKAKSEPSTRASVTFPAEVYTSLEIIAKQKKVSMAWVIRDAAEKYVSEQWPLFAGTKHE